MLLSAEPRVKNSILSIAVLFESAADVVDDKFTGVILTCANNDGAMV